MPDMDTGDPNTTTASADVADAAADEVGADGRGAGAETGADGRDAGAETGADGRDAGAETGADGRGAHERGAGEAGAEVAGPNADGTGAGLGGPGTEVAVAEAGADRVIADAGADGAVGEPDADEPTEDPPGAEPSPDRPDTKSSTDRAGEESPGAEPNADRADTEPSADGAGAGQAGATVVVARPSAAGPGADAAGAGAGVASAGAGVDVVVAGAGPAGLAVARACALRGLRTVLVAPRPQAGWRATYGMWLDEAAALLPPGAGYVVARARVIASSSRPLAREYVVLDNDSVRAALTHPEVTVRPGRLEDIDAPVVIDATGARPVGGIEQTAYGVIVPASVAAPVVQRGEAVFMDWRPPFPDGRSGPAAHPDQQPSPETRRPRAALRDRGPSPATFLYAVPLPDGRVLLEETSLAHNPGLPFTELRARLLARLRAHGIDPGTAPVERVRIPLDIPPTPRLARAHARCPAPTRSRGAPLTPFYRRGVTEGGAARGLWTTRGGEWNVVPFGAVAGLVHPATGFGIADALRLAPRVADAIASGDAAQARRVVASAHASGGAQTRRVADVMASGGAAQARRVADTIATRGAAHARRIADTIASGGAAQARRVVVSAHASGGAQTRRIADDIASSEATQAPRAADAVASGGAARARRVVWSARARAVYRLRRAGLSTLLALTPEQTVEFFELFFGLPPDLQRAYLSGRDDLAGTARAMAAIFAAAPWELRRKMALRR
jgi:lycopene beta-cyclase